MNNENETSSSVKIVEHSIDNSNLEENCTSKTTPNKVDIDKLNINILYYLYLRDKTDPMFSAKVIEILESFKEGKKDFKASYYTILRRMQKLVEKEYVAEGFKSSNAKTYYILKKGLDFLNENIINPEVIYEQNEINEDEINRESGER